MPDPKGAVLLVMHHPLVRGYLADGLVEDGFEALGVGNATEALALLEARPDIRLALADAEIPGTMDGLKLIRFIRDRWPPVKLIIVSGRTDLHAGHLPPEAKFFPKPFNDMAIVHEVNAMLSLA